MASEILKTRLAAFRKSREWLKEARDAEFKTGTPVRVRRDSGHDLYGLVVFDEQCPLTQLAVKLENGISWWYEVEDCHSVRRDDCPAWLRRILKKDSVVSVRALTRHLKNEGALWLNQTNKKRLNESGSILMISLSGTTIATFAV